MVAVLNARSATARLLRGLLGVLLLLALPAAHAVDERIKDIAQVAGVRSNHLVGYGLVVGLDGTGDQTSQAPFTTQSIENMLQRFGVTVPPNVNPQLNNVAAVMVTANLPPFAKPGQSIDVVVASIGNAKSLRGGALLMTPLRGADGQVYAVAQGNVVIGGVNAQGQYVYVLPTDKSGNYAPQALSYYDGGFYDPSRVVSRWSAMVTLNYSF